jgi:nitroimidazol reductase NimA-like FMN-containing flavoprotein (pyridoxamine 5'-phosphate oxidase superfamily)
MDEPKGETIPRRGRGTGGDQPESALPWAEAERRLNAGGWFWLATVRPDGAPHVMPVFALWSQGALYLASKDTARKSRNLAGEPRCVLTHDAGDVHLVVEGTARRVSDEATLRRVSAAYGEIYGWPTRVADGRLDADYGAPTSGGPPYDVYEVTPDKVIGLPTGADESVAPTRWSF